MKQDLFYNPNKMLSYNRILNFVIGGRGIGKTFGMKMFCIKRFIKTGEQMIYLRRHKDDLKHFSTFFNDVREYFPDNKLEVKNKQLFIDDKLFGWGIPLSTFQRMKSSSFPEVATILYDEFIKEKDSSHYLPNEPEALLNIMDTVFRNRDNNVRCVCMGNSITIVNPFFLYFNLLPDTQKRYNAYRDILVEIPDSVDFAEERKKTKFGQLIENTEYGGMSLNNEFVNDSNVFIGKRTKESRFQFAIVYKGMTMGVWADTRQLLLFLSTDFDPSTKHMYALTKDDMSENAMLFTGWRNNYHLKKLVGSFVNGCLMFENQVLRNIGYEIFNKMNIR